MSNTLLLALSVLLRLCLERFLNQCRVVNPDITSAMFVSCPQAAGTGMEKQFGPSALTYIHNEPGLKDAR